jgi:hypothetical protein
MTGKDFLPLAKRLAAGSTEPEWRTAVSRAYYAAFHVAWQLMEDLGFTVPREDRAHRYLWLRLANCGEPRIQKAGGDRNGLRRFRNQADYDLGLSFRRILAPPQIVIAERIIQTLDAIPAATRTQITDTMKIYERDVLKEVTWHP